MREGIWALVVIAAIFLLREAASLFVPIAIAGLIAAALEPVVRWIGRRGVGRAVAVPGLVLGLVALVAWGAYQARDDVVSALDGLPAAAARLRGYMASSRIQQAVHELNATATVAGSDTPRAGQPAAQTAVPSAGVSADALSSYVPRLAESGVSIAGDIVVVVFLVLFLLLDGPSLANRVVEVLARRNDDGREAARTVLAEVSEQIQRFLFVRLVTSAIVAAATWAVLEWMGVAQAPVWGLMAGVFNSIPYFGPIIVSGGLFLVGVVQGADLTRSLEMSGAALAITSIEGWLITPPLLGRAERMNAIVVFLGLLLWTWIWGAWGTILAVPMLSIVRAIAGHVKALEPIDRLMTE